MKENLKLIPEVFFDFLSYCLPGSFFIVILLLNSDSTIFGLLKDSSQIKEGFVIVFGGYLCGHLLTTLSSIILVKPLNLLFGNPIHTLIGVTDDNVFKVRPKMSDDIILKIRSIIQKEFSSNVDKHTFFLCENFIRINHPDIGYLIRKRHAFEHLCRNVAVASLILLFIIEGVEIKLLFGFIAGLSFIRYLDYRVSWPKVVYESFLLFSLGKSTKTE